MEIQGPSTNMAWEIYDIHCMQAEQSGHLCCFLVSKSVLGYGADPPSLSMNLKRV